MSTASNVSKRLVIDGNVGAVSAHIEIPELGVSTFRMVIVPTRGGNRVEISGDFMLYGQLREMILEIDKELDKYRSDQGWKM